MFTYGLINKYLMLKSIGIFGIGQIIVLTYIICAFNFLTLHIYHVFVFFFYGYNNLFFVARGNISSQ